MNFGGVSLAGLVNNRRKFGPTLPGIAHMRHTHLPANLKTRGEPVHGADLADDLTRFVNLYGAENIAACIVEPIAGSTGCLVPPKGYLARLRQICDQHGILLIFDEVITGFGRTGQAFAADSFGVVPDIMTMAKALTNAAMPMGAVAASTRIHDAIIDAAPEGAIEFFHGYTYSGHPAACAAGLATLDIYRNDGLFERGQALSPYFQDAIFSLADHPAVADVRGYGMITGIDLHPVRHAGRARPRIPEEALRQWHAPQSHRRLRDRGAAAHRREVAHRHDDRHPAQDAVAGLKRLRAATCLDPAATVARVAPPRVPHRPHVTPLAARLLPFLAWRHRVGAATWRADLTAGAVGALVVLPQGVAYATLAGLPPAIRALLRDRAGHRRGAVRLVVAPGVRPDQRAVARGARDAGAARRCPAAPTTSSWCSRSRCSSASCSSRWASRGSARWSTSSRTR